MDAPIQNRDRQGAGLHTLVRIALANFPFPASPEESVSLAEHSIGQAASERAGIVFFPECFIPGLRGVGKKVSAPDAAFLEAAWASIARAAAVSNVGVVLGTERIADGALLASVLVINPDGTQAGFQD